MIEKSIVVLIAVLIIVVVIGCSSFKEGYDDARKREKQSKSGHANY